MWWQFVLNIWNSIFSGGSTTTGSQFLAYEIKVDDVRNILLAIDMDRVINEINIKNFEYDSHSGWDQQNDLQLNTDVNGEPIVHLLGLQFKFKLIGENKSYFNEMEIYQVYYFELLNVLFKVRVDELLPTDLSQSKYQILYQGGIHELGNNVSQSFQELDYFPRGSQDKIDFVYFTIDQLAVYSIDNVTGQNFKRFLLSGSQILFGKKLEQIQWSDEEKFSDPYFTLKAEGLEIVNVDQEEVELPHTALGHPCPPEWYMVGVIMDQVRKINPSLGIESITTPDGPTITINHLELLRETFYSNILKD